MNAESTILSLLNKEAELLYWNHTKLEQKAAKCSGLTILVGLLMIIFLPAISPIAIGLLTLFTIAFFVVKYVPYFNVKTEACSILAEWKPIRCQIMNDPDFEFLSFLVSSRNIDPVDLPNNPKLELIKSRFNYRFEAQALTTA